MKYVVAIVLFIGILPARSSEKLEVAEKLYAAMNVESTIGQMMEAMGPSIKQMVGQMVGDASMFEDKEVSRLMDEVMTIGFESFPVEDFKKMTLSVYTEVYTLEELSGILAFYQSPEGKAMVQKQGQVIQQSGVKMQPILAAWYPVLQEKIDTHIKAFMESKK